MFRAILSRNVARPVWWTANETVSDFGGRPAIVKAVKDADHNVKVAADALRKVNRMDDVAVARAYDALEQAKANREILDTIYDDTAY